MDGLILKRRLDPFPLHLSREHHGKPNFATSYLRSRNILSSRLRCGKKKRKTKLNPKLSNDFSTIRQGHTFKHQIEELVRDSKFLNDELLPAYNTVAGLKIYDDTLARMKTKFPHYVKELQGISDGSQVPFYKVQLNIL